jgi:DUF4097 and DUF4098 domain-containing protein YvlB
MIRHHRHLPALVPVLLLAGTPAALGDVTVRESFEIAPDGEVEIANVEGSIDVRSGPDGRVELTAELEGDAEQLQISHDGRRVRIRVEPEKRMFGDGRPQKADLEVTVPVGVRLTVSSVSADITVRDHAGIERVQSVSGDVDIEGSSPDAEVESISGDVEYRGNGTRGRFEVSAVSGDAVVVDVAGELHLASVSGDARLQSAELTDARLESVSGDVRLEARLAPGARLEAETVSGDVTLHLCERRDVAFDLESFSGRIRDRVTGREPRRDGFGPGAELRFTEGDGTTRVEVNTMSGGIEIRDCD